MNDLVSYNEKHNLENGEDNRDGYNDNRSWNCGVEGDTKRSRDHKAKKEADEELHGVTYDIVGRTDDNRW